MMKLSLILSGLLMVNFSYSQIGINTETPNQLFHIDPLKNTLGGNDVADDVVVTNTGRLGIGTISPSVKLHIESPTPGAIRIDDGTQADGQILTSDNQGRASWQHPLGSILRGTSIVETLLLSEAWSLTSSSIIIPANTACIINALAQFHINIAGQPGLFMAFSTSNTSFVNASPSAQVIFNRQYSEADNHLICNGFVTDIKNTTNAPVTLFLWVKTDVSAGNVTFVPTSPSRDIRLYAVIY